MQKKYMSIVAIILFSINVFSIQAMKQKNEELIIQEQKTIFEDHADWLSDLLCPNNNMLVSSHVDGTVKVWNVTTGKCLKTVTDCADSKNYLRKWNRIDLAYLDKKTIAICSNEKITFLNLTTGECSNISNIPNIEFSCFVHINKSLFCFGSSPWQTSKNIEFMNIATPQKTEKLMPVSFIILDMFSFSNNLLIVKCLGNGGGISILLDATTGKCLCPLNGFEIPSAVDIGNNIFAFITKGPHYNIVLWNIKTNKIINELKGHKYLVSALAYLGDNILVSSSYDCSIKFWNIQNGVCLKEINLIDKPEQHQLSFLASIFNKILTPSQVPTSICKLLISPDKRSLFVGLDDGRIIKLEIPQAFWPKKDFPKNLLAELKNKKPKLDIFFKFEN